MGDHQNQDESETLSIQDLFTKVAEMVRQTTPVKVNDTQKLELYGLFKQATEGDNSTPSPGLLDFVGRSKWNAWNILSGLSQSDAKVEYIRRVTTLYRFTSTEKGAEQEVNGEGGQRRRQGSSSSSSGGDDVGFGTRISSMGPIGLHGCQTREGEQAEEEEQIDIFYHAKRGQVDEVTARISQGEASINAQDEEGRSLLHWAVDGNHLNLIVALLKAGADTGLKDSEGETPYDYAILCEYEEAAKLLSSSSNKR